MYIKYTHVSIARCNEYNGLFLVELACLRKRNKIRCSVNGWNMGLHGNRTRDLSHPKRESYH